MKAINEIRTFLLPVKVQRRQYLADEYHHGGEHRVQWWDGGKNITAEPFKTYTCLLTHMRLDSETKLPMRDLLLPQQQGDELPQRRRRKDCEHHAAATTAGIRDAATS